MTSGQLFRVAWDFEPTVIIGSVALFIGYLWAVRFRMNRKTAIFGSGVLLMLLTLIGPLDFLGDNYLFSAHMLEHILLELAVPPLLLLGLPQDTMRSLLSINIAAKTERFLSRPAVAWVLAVGTLWLWHLPVLYNAALNHEGIHAVEHLSMLVTGTIFWWPVYTPLKDHRISPVGGFVYVFVATMANMILGIMLAFSPVGHYPRYMRSTDGTGIFHLIRTVWHLSPRLDLNLGGMFMWIVGGLLYFVSMMVVISRLYLKSEAQAPEEKGSGGAARSENQSASDRLSRDEQEGRENWSVPKPDVIPSPTYWPFVLSLGSALMGLGVLTSNIISIAGIVLFFLAIVKWFGELSLEK